MYIYLGAAAYLQLAAVSTTNHHKKDHQPTTKPTTSRPQHTTNKHRTRPQILYLKKHKNTTTRPQTTHKHDHKYTQKTQQTYHKIQQKTTTNDHNA